MKNLKIISRREAMNRLTNSVFVSGGTLSPFPLSREKYDWYGERAYIGQVLSVNNEVDCVYVEKQQDYENGVFCVFMCMMKSSRTERYTRTNYVHEIRPRQANKQQTTESRIK